MSKKNNVAKLEVVKNEEEIMENQVEVEVEETVPTKKWSLKKKLIVAGGAILGLGLGALALSLKGKKNETVDEDEIDNDTDDVDAEDEELAELEASESSTETTF